MTKVHVFGDSHVNALCDGAALLADIPRIPAVELAFYARHGINWIDFDRSEIDGAFHVFGATVPDDRPVDYAIDDRSAVYVFASPLFSGPTSSHDTWRYCCPSRCSGANPNLHAVSTAVVESFVERQLTCRFELLSRLKACAYTVAVVEPPKPVHRAPTLFGIRPDVLLAADHIHRRYVIDRLKAHDIPIICVPQDTYSDGFTIDAYAREDPTDTHHGNAKFGARMMEQIIQFAQQSTRGAAASTLN